MISEIQVYDIYRYHSDFIVRSRSEEAKNGIAVDCCVQPSTNYSALEETVQHGTTWAELEVQPIIYFR